MAEEVKAPTPEEVLVKMKENYVPKAEAEEWREKYNSLFASVADGSFGKDEEEQTESEEELAKKFNQTVQDFCEHKIKGSCEGITKMLEIDDYLTGHGKRSIFLPSMGDITPEIEESAKHFREFARKLIEDSEGSDDVCNALLGNRLMDA